MKLILFLGSGVSLASGLPGVPRIMELLLDAPYARDATGRFYCDHTGRLQPQHQKDILQIRAFLKLLQEHDELDRQRVGLSNLGSRYVASGPINRPLTTYEDLFGLCQLINQWMLGLSDNSATTPFLDLMERRADAIVTGTDRDARTIAVGHLAQTACLFIQAVVADALAATGISGLDLVVELARSPAIQQLNIVTLNHDTLVERLLASAGVRVVDGFGSEDGTVRWRDDERYDEADARVMLFKLHGSIDWYSFARQTQLWPAILCRGSVTEAVDSAGTLLKPASRNPSFLSGGYKEAWYQHDMYADIHFRFHQVLRRCDRMVMCGYGWGDTGVTNQLLHWLERRPQNKLVLLDGHRDVHDLKQRSLMLAMAYDGLVETGQLIHLNRWLSNTSLQDIAEDLA